ncbi:MAG: C39 family peptidase [Anaerolineales bacterium]|nr:C39 family peptidase [Anaerolineales bacterium]
MRKAIVLISLSILVLCLCLALVYILPPVNDRLAWRVEELILRIKYSLHPPGQVIFIPQGQASATPEGSSLPDPVSTSTPAPSPSADLSSSPTAEFDQPTQPTATHTPVPSPTVASTPLPERVELKGVRYEDQHGSRTNYCAPANLAMALSYWNWRGNRDVVGPVLKPNDKDKNVMPYEMAAYVENNTDLKVVERVGGDLQTIKSFVAAGYPVLVEKGLYHIDLTGVVSWMGHYQVVTGFDEAGGYFITQDSLIKPDFEVAYEAFYSNWRAFNYIYLVIYPADRQNEVMALLGSQADETANYQHAALKASNEIMGLSGIDQYFAWFNRGTNLAELQDYAGAAVAYDEAFKVYPTIPESERPWRMLWYQTGPYWAYFYSQRYYDVLYLADGTLKAMQGEKNLEESYYWRGMARATLGDTQAAIEDYRLALKYHPGFEPALYQLRLLGVEDPG